MRALLQQSGKAWSRQLLRGFCPGLGCMTSQEHGSRAATKGKHNLPVNETDLGNMQQSSLWQQVLNAGKHGGNAVLQDSRKRQRTSSGDNLLVKKPGPRLNTEPSQKGTQPRMGKDGITDLGQGASVIYAPAAFSARESSALYQSLKVCAGPAPCCLTF